ncbi:hypothetical protein DFP73DRAFT_60321, partial [Morchella snyderi]
TLYALYPTTPLPHHPPPSTPTIIKHPGSSPPSFSKMANVQYQAGLRFGHALAIQQVRDVVDKLFHPDVINSLTIVLDRISMPPFPFEFSSPRAALATTSGPSSGVLYPDPITRGFLAIPPMPMYIAAAPSPPHPAPEPYLLASPTHHHHTSGSLHSTASCLPDSSNREDSEEPPPAPSARRRGRTPRDAPAALIKEKEQEYTAPVQPLRRGVRATRSRVSYAEPSVDAAEPEDAHEAYVPRPDHQRRHALYFGTLIDSDSEDAAPAQSAGKRGRPRKWVVPDLKQEEEEVPDPRRRLSTTASSTKAMVEEDLSAVQAPKKRGRGGRPKKNVLPAETLVVADLRQEEEEEAPAPKRGRPSSTIARKGLTPVQAPKKRGRPAKTPSSQAGRSVLVPFGGKLIDQEVKRGNGRRRKVVVSDTDTSIAEAYRAASKYEEDWEW